MLKRSETIIFIVLTFGIITLDLLQLDETFFLYGIGGLLLQFLFGCNLIYAIIRLVKDRRSVVFFDKVKPLILASVCVGFFFLVSYLVDTDGGKTRVITCGFNHGLNFVRLQLFADNKFKFLNSSPFGGTFYRGNYRLLNNTLRIENDSLKQIHPSITFLYPSLTFALKQGEDKQEYFFPVDTLKSMWRLRVYEDYRANK